MDNPLLRIRTNQTWLMVFYVTTLCDQKFYNLRLAFNLQYDAKENYKVQVTNDIVIA